MKYFIALSAAILAASAMPTDIGKGDTDMLADTDNEAAAFNVTRNIPFGQSGFATLNGGTRGGEGGAVWTVWDPWALRDAVTGNDRRIIYVRGRIDLLRLFTGSPGVRFSVGSFKSIIGGDANAMIFGGGLVISSTQQVIIRNLKFHNALSFAPGEQHNGNGGIVSQVPGPWSTIDNIGIERNAQNVWIDHCEFADDPWNAATLPADRRRHDGLIDITRGASYISISNSLFRNHNHAMLVGNDDNLGAVDRGRLKITYYLNWFQGTNQRHPRVRFGEVHILNNLFTNIGFYGIGVGFGSQLYVERNVFVNTRRAWVFAGTVSQSGLRNVDNILQNSAHDPGIPSDTVRWVPSQYYRYNAMPVANVQAHVQRHAGTW